MYSLRSWELRREQRHVVRRVLTLPAQLHTIPSFNAVHAQCTHRSRTPRRRARALSQVRFTAMLPTEHELAAQSVAIAEARAGVEVVSQARALQLSETAGGGWDERAHLKYVLGAEEVEEVGGGGR